MNWPVWNPKSVPSQMQHVLEQILEGLVDGTIALTQVDKRANIRGPDRFAMELVDVATRLRSTTAPAKSAGFTFVTPTYVSPVANTSVQAPSPRTIPDLGVIAEPVIGFRDFVLRTSIDGPILMSRNDHPWVYRKRMRAICASSNSQQPFSRHDAPHLGCDCGIYAYSRPDDPNLQQTNVVWGEIAMWGEVLICPHGYRSQFAYPLNLFIRDNETRNVHYLAEELQDLYGVPCFVVAEREGKTAQQVMSEIVESLLTDVKDEGR